MTGGLRTIYSTIYIFSISPNKSGIKRHSWCSKRHYRGNEIFPQVYSGFSNSRNQYSSTEHFVYFLLKTLLHFRVIHISSDMRTPQLCRRQVILWWIKKKRRFERFCEPEHIWACAHILVGISMPNHIFHS